MFNKNYVRYDTQILARSCVFSRYQESMHYQAIIDLNELYTAI